MKFTKSKKFISFFLSFTLCLLFILSSAASVFAAQSDYVDFIGITTVNKKTSNLYAWYGLTKIPTVSVNTYNLFKPNDGYTAFNIDLSFDEFWTFLIATSQNWGDSSDPYATNAESYTINYDDLSTADKAIVHYGGAVSDFMLMHKSEIDAKYEGRSLIGKLFGKFTETTVGEEIFFNNWLEAVISAESSTSYTPEDICIPLTTGKGYKAYYNIVEGYFKLVYNPDNIYHVSLGREYITPTDYRTVYYYTNDSAFFDQNNPGGTSVDIYTTGEATNIEVGDKTVTQYEYNQNPQNNVTMSNDAQQFLDIESGATVTFENTAPVFDASQKQFFVTVYDNKYYTYNNYYSYYNYNYYMPGTDIPFSTYNVYFELPDGRSSADMTLEELKGTSTGWQLKNYTVATEDPYQQALFHFDGNIDNSGAYNPLHFDSNSILLRSENLVYSQQGPYPMGAISNTSGGVYFTGNRWGSCLYYFEFYLPTSGYYDINFSTGNTISSFDRSGACLYSGRYGSLGEIIENYGGKYDGSAGVANFTARSVSSIYLYSGYYTLKFYLSVRFEVPGIDIFYSFVSEVWTPENIVQIGADNPTHFEWLDNAIYQFVTTGDDNYGGALYLDGLAHKFKINQTVGSVKSGYDFTCTFRWYQEISTSTANHYIYIGSDSSNALAYLQWTGETIGYLGCNNTITTINERIPVGSWNTITITRQNDQLFVFLNGLLIGQKSIVVNYVDNDYIVFDFEADDNVKYFDEYMFADVCLYTGNHIPRLVPYDTSNVLVYPYNYTPNMKTLAVKSIIPVAKYRIGGARPTYPEYGDVYCHLSDKKYIDSCQIWNGYMWLEVDCSIGYGGTWLSPSTFNVNTLKDDYVAKDPPGTYIEAPTTIWDFLNNLIAPIQSLLQHIADGVGGAVDSLANLITNVLNSVKDLILDFVSLFVHLVRQLFNNITTFFGSLISNITGFFSGHNEVFQVFSDFYYALPNGFQVAITGAFSVLILLGFFRWFK